MIILKKPQLIISDLDKASFLRPTRSCIERMRKMLLKVRVFYNLMIFIGMEKKVILKKRKEFDLKIHKLRQKIWDNWDDDDVIVKKCQDEIKRLLKLKKNCY